MQFTGASCRAIDYETNTLRCREFYISFVNQIIPTLTAKDLIIVSSNWWNTHEHMGDKKFEYSLKEIAGKLHYTGANVILIGNTPDFIKDPYELYMKGLDRGDFFFPTQNYKDSNAIIKRVALELDIAYFYPTAYLCQDSFCQFKDDSDYLFFDSGHLSSHGSVALANYIKQEFSNLFQ